MIVLKKVFAIFYKDLLNEASYRFAFVMQFLGMFFAALSLYFLSKMLGHVDLPSLAPYGGDYFSFVLIGVAFASYLQVSLGSFSSSIRNSQLLGTLEAVLLTQTRIPTIVLSSSIYSFFMASLRVFVFLGIGVVLLGVEIGSGNFWAAFVILVLTIVCFSSFGIISASFIMVLKKGDPLNWLFVQVSWLLGGVYYPVAILPGWAQKISQVLPMTHALEGMRMALLKGADTFALLPHLLPLAFFSFLLLPISLLSFKYAINKARDNGSLTHY